MDNSSSAVPSQSYLSGYKTLTGQLADACGKAEKRLDEMEHKVDVVIAEAGGASSSEKTSDLLRTLQEIRAEYEGLTKEVAELKSEQESSMAEILSQLQTASGHILKLQASLGPVPDGEHGDAKPGH